MWNKVLAFFLAVLIILIPIEVSGQEIENLEGQVTALGLNEKAPFAGILLDNVAASKMIADKKYAALELELELRKEFAKQFADKKMAFDLLSADHTSLLKTHEELLRVKNAQIDDLNKFIKDEIGPDYSSLWFAGGVLAGILVSVAIFFAAVEIRDHGQ